MADIADYVIDQGTTGAWTYRVWNSGIAECWGYSPYTGTTTFQSWGKIYYATPELTGISYPTNFFTTTPSNVTVEWIPYSSDTWSAQKRQTGSASIAPDPYIFRASTATDHTGHYRFYALGTINNNWFE